MKQEPTKTPPGVVGIPVVHGREDVKTKTTRARPLITLAILGLTPAEWSGPYGKYRCAEKTTASQKQKRQRDEVESRQRIADSHYPMFEVGEVS